MKKTLHILSLIVLTTLLLFGTSVSIKNNESTICCKPNHEMCHHNAKSESSKPCCDCLCIDSFTAFYIVIPHKITLDFPVSTPKEKPTPRYNNRYTFNFNNQLFHPPKAA